ncbi:MAG TPA: cytochrome c [Verrucomicrobiae bacterium]|nr:cytochrome c [Verrucomicrobiae bacterium]
MRDGFRLGAIVLLPALGIGADTNKPQVTFAKDIAPIFQEKCQECHRAGTAAPMSLVTYEETRPWAKAIRQRVITRNMPPWHIDKTVGIQHFANDRSLNDAQISTIVSWVDAGSPMGDPKDLPPARKFPEDEDWQLAKVYGQPELVLKSDDYTMPAHGQDVWFKPLTEVPLTEARWVRAVEMRPGTLAGRKIMHHVLARLIQEEPAGANSSPAADGGGAANAGLLMEWAIGKNYDIYRPNCGKLLLPGSHIWWELHLHAVGEAIRDHAELAVYFYPKGETPKYRTYLTLFSGTPVFGSGIDIAPNSIAESQGYHLLRAPARLENFQPHMHLRGKAMAMEAILPDGTTRMLSYVDHFNFNWMNNYIYAEDAAPVLPRGTIIHVTAWHDNTRNNPNNPDPDQWVGFGDRTVDEMAHAWVNVTYMSDADYAEWLAQHSARRPASTGSQQ